MIQGRYVVEVKLNGYSNPTGKCADSRCNTTSGRTCCDSYDTAVCSGDERCDSYFIYCLRPFGEVRQNPAGCFSNETRMSTTAYSANKNDEPLDFSQSTVLGLPNPQSFSGFEEAYEGIQLYIEIQDYDRHSDDELVDILLINHNLTVAQPRRQNHTGMYNFVTMDLTITVFCTKNFQGANCTQCVPGFTGSSCNVRDNYLGVTCSGNGKCASLEHNSYVCKCNRGYTGRLCDNINCTENNCSGNGVCMDGVNISTSSANCNCNVGFTGRACEIKIDECEALASDSVASCLPVLPRILAGALGGSGVLLVLILSLLLTIACLRRKFKMMNHSERPPQPGQFDLAEKSAQQIQSDQVFELKNNEADAFITRYIPTEDNVAYGRSAAQTSTEDYIYSSIY